MLRRRWRLHCGGRGLRFWYAQGSLSLSLEQGWQDLHFWSAQGGLSASGVSMGAAKMGKQSSLRGCESVVSGDGILVPGAPPGLASLSGHGGKNQGVGEMQGGRGGAVVVRGSSDGAQSASDEARRAEKHCAEVVACNEQEKCVPWSFLSPLGAIDAPPIAIEG
jgi:hypothetical protein